MANGIQDIFNKYANEIEDETKKKEEISLVVKDLEKYGYNATTVLEKIHSNKASDIDSILSTCEEILTNVCLSYEKLAHTIPKNQYYRYHFLFRYTTYKLVFISTYLLYLQKNRLSTYEEVAEKLGLKTTQEDGFHLDLEDYLQGSLLLSSELARLSVNSVSSGDYAKPFQIIQFLRELHSSFSLLNPKGDLRKKFDELKYSLKKAEEVVYNLTLRGLKPADLEKPAEV